MTRSDLKQNDLKRARGSRRNQKVSVATGTGGGGEGVPDERELKADFGAVAEKGDTVGHDPDRTRS